MSEGQKVGVKTTLTDFFFIIRNDARKEDFANKRMESLWQALEYLRGASGYEEHCVNEKVSTLVHCYPLTSYKM